MPTYDYRCKEHGDFELVQRMKDHARADCPTCGSDSKQVLTAAPGLDIEAMARAGMPGAWETVGDRIHKRHIDAGQELPTPILGRENKHHTPLVGVVNIEESLTWLQF